MRFSAELLSRRIFSVKPLLLRSGAVMRLGMSLPYTQPDGRAPAAQQLATRAALLESVGFEVIAQGDHIGSATRVTPDSLTWLAIAASATTRCWIASGIIQVPLRHPTELANRLMSMHAVSGGRFVAGLGAGSSRFDYDAVGVDYERRFATLGDALPRIRALLRGESHLKPWLGSGDGPPMLIGAWASGRWVRKAAREYDGWMGSGAGHASFRELCQGLRIFRDNGGKRAMLMTVTIDLRAHRGRPLAEDEPFSLACEPAEASDWLHRLADVGFDDVCLQKFGHTEANLPEEALHEMRALL
jgi:alkanesulfonate monooxygenase SsuD/methylene tetrahydromethanopterin reductase-like flavin-dependent oxidoreductase (luciferase family)